MSKRPAPADRSRQPTVWMVVESDRYDLHTLYLILNAYHPTIVIESYEHGLGALGRIFAQNRSPIAAVILDMILPGVSGEELARVIRSQWPTTRILAVTARAADPTVLALCDQVVAKPYEIPTMRQALATLAAPRPD